MSRKAKREQKNRKRQLTANGTRNCHHIFYQRTNWGRGALSILRQYPYCKAYIERETLHATIHSKIGNVPTPKPVNALEAVRQLQCLKEQGAITENDSIVKRLIVLIALFDDIEPKTANALQRQLDIVCKFYDKPS
jgi:hypothetical protein